METNLQDGRYFLPQVVFDGTDETDKMFGMLMLFLLVPVSAVVRLVLEERSAPQENSRSSSSVFTRITFETENGLLWIALSDSHDVYSRVYEYLSPTMK